MFGELLVETGFHSSGNEILYGMDGTQVEMEIFVGPTYYMRLKHMVGQDRTIVLRDLGLL
jgi:DNA-directed RNA polymerase beta subunit